MFLVVVQIVLLKLGNVLLEGLDLLLQLGLLVVSELYVAGKLVNLIVQLVDLQNLLVKLMLEVHVLLLFCEEGLRLLFDFLVFLAFAVSDDTHLVFFDDFVVLLELVVLHLVFLHVVLGLNPEFVLLFSIFYGFSFFCMQCFNSLLKRLDLVLFLFKLFLQYFVVLNKLVLNLAVPILDILQESIHLSVVVFQGLIVLD